MADNFGLKIGVEGEKEFKNALRDINQAFKVLGMLWSSFFVTLVAKKYRLATMLPFVPRMVCDSR